jgi:hypothetical protein
MCTVTRSIIVPAALSCVEREPVPPRPQAPVAAISDATHASGIAHFYFLPPLVRAPSFSGTFDLSPSPVVRICEWSNPGCGSIVAEFTSSAAFGIACSTTPIRVSDAQ